MSKIEFQLPLSRYRNVYRYTYLALFHALKDAIREGRYEPGTRLPSSREMAGLYGISRGTVTQVYEMLAAEGLMQLRAGSGCYVSVPASTGGNREGTSPAIGLSSWGERVAELPERRHGLPDPWIDFTTLGLPDPQVFPFKEWNRSLYASVRDTVPARLQDAYAIFGDENLRGCMAKLLRRTRGIVTDASHIAIVSGSMQAIALLSMLLLEPGAAAVIENPGYSGYRHAVTVAGGNVLAAEIETDGLAVDDWPAQVLFVTPGRQFPTGAALGMEKRLAVLEWARRRQAVIIEDDYDTAFRRGGRPLEPLKSLDAEDRVVFVGSFTKTMFTGLRIGYVVLPDSLVPAFRRAKQLFDPHPANLVEQRALASFIAGGQYERHMRRMNRIYRRKHDRIWECLNRELGAWFDWRESDAGLHLFGEWRGSEDLFDRWHEACLEARIHWVDARPYYVHKPKPSALFGFSHLSEQGIDEGVRAIGAILRELQGS